MPVLTSSESVNTESQREGIHRAGRINGVNLFEESMAFILLFAYGSGLYEIVKKSK